MNERIDETYVSENVQRPWSTGKRILFLFGFSYIVLYCVELLAFIFSIYGYVRSSRTVPPHSFTDPIWHHVVPWVGEHILNLHSPITIFPASSTDTTYNWVLIFVDAAIALITAMVVFGFDRRRAGYSAMYSWLRVIVRTVLGGTVLFYGIDKVVPVQFGSLSLTRLSGQIGDLSPMGLLWTFMAASPTYTILTGVAETAGGILLLIPETTLLGALLTAATMANVFALNMSYDVPEKQLTFHLFLLSLFLLLPNCSRLVKVLVLNHNAGKVIEPPVSRRSRLRLVARIVPLAFGLWIPTVFLPSLLTRYSSSRATTTSHFPEYGVWRTKVFEVADSSPSLFTEKMTATWKLAPADAQWQRLVLESPHIAAVQLGDGSYQPMQMEWDVKNDAITMTNLDDPAWRCVLFVQKRTANDLQMNGTVNNHAFSATFSREDRSGYILVNRGFHWISEDAFF